MWLGGWTLAKERLAGLDGMAAAILATGRRLLIPLASCLGVNRIEVVGLFGAPIDKLRVRATWLLGRGSLHFPPRLTARQELLWTRGIRLVN